MVVIAHGALEGDDSASHRFLSHEALIFAQNAQHILHVVERDLLGREAMQRLQKIRNIVLITQLLGVIDVLRHVKNLSLALQRVNALPWELEGEIAVSLDLLRMLAADLEQGNLDRMMAPDCANGKAVPTMNFCGSIACGAAAA